MRVRGIRRSDIAAPGPEAAGTAESAASTAESTAAGAAAGTAPDTAAGSAANATPAPAADTAAGGVPAPATTPPPPAPGPPPPPPPPPPAPPPPAPATTTSPAARAGTPPPADPSPASATPSRQDLDPGRQWRLTDIYPDDAAWERDFRRLQEGLPAAADPQGHLGDGGGTTLLQALEARDAMNLLLERLYAYAHMRCDEDTRVAASQARLGRIAALASHFETAWAWFEPELLGLPEPELRGWIETPPPGAQGLARYRHALDTLLRQQPHVLPRAEEELLARAGEIARAPQTIFGMLNDADLTFPPVRDAEGRPLELTPARFVRFLENPRRALRAEAFHNLYGTYGQHRHTLAATLGASVQRDWFFARARRYGSCIEMALDPDAIPVAVYDSLVAAVRAGLPALHRYLGLRRRALGLDRLHMYDLYVPLVPEPEPDVAWDEAVETVAAALAPLGEDYVRSYRAGIGGGWVDVLENRGKRGGAYSSGVYGVHPYVLLNYQGTLGDVFTLAHEFGHALHSQATNAAQPFVYSDYSIFVAEVASTVNEALLARHLIARATESHRRAYLLNRHLEGFRTTVFRQTMFAEFERQIHARVERDEPLTAETLCADYLRLNRDYLCHDPSEVELDPEIDLEWARIPHFYRPFYVYQYATGFSAAQALAASVLDGGEPARRRYLAMLERGASADPLVLLRDAGVDLTSPAPVARAIEAFARGVDELAGLLA